MVTQESPSHLYCNVNDVLAVLPISRSALNLWIAKGRFPEPIPALSSRRKWWYRAEVSAWLRNNQLPSLPDTHSDKVSA